MYKYRQQRLNRLSRFGIQQLKAYTLILNLNTRNIFFTPDQQLQAAIWFPFENGWIISNWQQQKLNWNYYNADVLLFLFSLSLSFSLKINFLFSLTNSSICVPITHAPHFTDGIMTQSTIWTPSCILVGSNLILVILHALLFSHQMLDAWGCWQSSQTASHIKKCKKKICSLTVNYA